MPRNWLAVGSPKNWQRAFEQGNLWGLKEPHRNLWETVEKGDRLVIYASTPVGGAVGIATIVNKLIQTHPLWQEEIERNEVIYPFIMEFQVNFALPFEQWKTDKLVNEVIKRRVKFRQTFQILEDALASQLVSALMGTPESTTVQRPLNLHDQIIANLFEAGQLQNYIAEKEYDMEGTKLDVVWRRVPKAVPAYVFEVHIGGELYQALAKLKHAFDIWNSNIFLVIQPKDKKNVDRLMAGVFHEISDKLRIMEASAAQELRNRKQQLHALEKGLGIL